MNQEQVKALRAPFPPEVIGKLPKGGTTLDYVGHAAVTDRLLSVDPEWSWEPLGVTEHGLPALDESGNLWIRLTVADVTRLGVGDGKNMKERIGDAIRNAAMRFGVALDLWSKDELESTTVATRAAADVLAERVAGITDLGELRAMYKACGSQAERAVLKARADELAAEPKQEALDV